LVLHDRLSPIVAAPMAIRIVTWNINSVRFRLAAVERLIAEFHPDVLCLQETKVVDEHFPLVPLAALGYRHTLLHGMKSYNGVAILSRLPLENALPKSWCDRNDCRHAMVRLPGNIELHNVYVPAGGDIPDPIANQKFAHKLRFLDEMTEWFQSQDINGRRSILVGDLNVAPLETDVWSHRQLLDVVSHTPVEVARFEKLQATRAWVDAVRHFVPRDQKLFSWWSYRARDWSASNRGRRLDHVWVTPSLAGSLASIRVLREARGWELPSDHVPVIADLA
jgi:exodeoxyribonuclease-3